MSDMDLLPHESDFSGQDEPYDLALITPNQDNPDDRPPTGDSTLEYDTSGQFDNKAQTVVEEDYTRPVSKYIQAVMDYPSDKLILRTFTIPANNPLGPTLILNRQVQGWACRVRIRNVGAKQCYLLTSNEQAASSATGTTVYPTGFLLAAGAELALTTRDAIWAIVAGTTGTDDATISVASESYVC